MIQEEKIEIPFGANDSELKGWEYTIPEGMEAVIENGKVIVRQRVTEDEKIRKFICSIIDNLEPKDFVGVKKMDVLAWLEKQRINTEGDFARGYDCGYECCLNSHGAEWFEKQKEKKQEVKDPFDDEEFCRGYEAGKNDARNEAERSYGFKYPYYEPPCFHGGICTNPFRDCINCPRIGGVIGISTTSGTNKRD